MVGFVFMNALSVVLRYSSGSLVAFVGGEGNGIGHTARLPLPFGPSSLEVLSFCERVRKGLSRINLSV